VKFAYEVTAFFIGVLGYRATIYDTYIGRLIYTNPLEASLLELTGEGRALRKVELTAQCMETYSTFHLKKSNFTLRKYKKFIGIEKSFDSNQ
jgi:hypothetical protein